MPKGLPLAGTLIAISERGYDENGNIQGFLIGGPKPGTFSVKRTDDFDVSRLRDARRSDLLILERRYSSCAVWRCASAAFRSPRSCRAQCSTAPTLIFADIGYQIDNMEGLTVHRGAKGDIVLTLVSDDNFSLDPAHDPAAVHVAGEVTPYAAAGGALLLDLALELERPRGELVVLGLRQEGVEPAAMIDRSSAHWRKCAAAPSARARRRSA